MLEQHPVPQNVTTFQFRLIGDMTLKQFGYLAGGVILAYISYNLPLPFFFTYPLTGIFALGGIGFAFVPVEERPMDVWFVSFIKSIYSPTQYVWQREAETKTTPSQSSNTNPITQLADRILPIPKATTQKVSSTTSLVKQSTQGGLSSVLSYFSPKKNSPATQQVFTPVSTQAVMASAPIPQKVNTPPIQSNTTQQQIPVSNPNTSNLQQQLKNMEEQLEKERQEKQNMTNLQQQLIQAQNEKKQLEQELLQIKQQLNSNPSQQMPQQPVRKAPAVNTDAPKSPPMPSVSNHPNIVSGIVREPNGNMLVGILVTVKDKDDIPVRALKTNKIGQFASSTPLNNGTYTIEAEDPKKQFSFDIVTLELSGSAISPIQLIAKSKQQLERQQLEQALFGNKQ